MGVSDGGRTGAIGLLLGYAGGIETQAMLVRAAAHLALSPAHWSAVQAKTRDLLDTGRLSPAGIQQLARAAGSSPDPDARARLYETTLHSAPALHRTVLDSLARRCDTIIIPDLMEKVRQGDFGAAHSLIRYDGGQLEGHGDRIVDLVGRRYTPSIDLCLGVVGDRIGVNEPLTDVIDRYGDRDVSVAQGTGRRIRKRFRGNPSLRADTVQVLRERTVDKPGLRLILDELSGEDQTVRPALVSMKNAQDSARRIITGEIPPERVGEFADDLARLNREALEQIIPGLVSHATQQSRANPHLQLYDTVSEPFDRYRTDDKPDPTVMVRSMEGVFDPGSLEPVTPDPAAVLMHSDPGATTAALLDYMNGLDPIAEEAIARILNDAVAGNAEAYSSDEIAPSSEVSDAEPRRTTEGVSAPISPDPSADHRSIGEKIAVGHGEASRPHRTHPFVRRTERPAPPLEAGSEFDVEIGLSPKPGQGGEVVGRRGHFPTNRDFEVRVTLSLDGLRLADRNNEVILLSVTNKRPYPSRRIGLVVTDEPADTVTCAASFDVENRSVAKLRLAMPIGDGGAGRHGDGGSINGEDGNGGTDSGGPNEVSTEGDMAGGEPFNAAFTVDVLPNEIRWIGRVTDSRPIPGRTAAEFSEGVRSFFNAATDNPKRYRNRVESHLKEIGRLIPPDIQRELVQIVQAGADWAGDESPTVELRSMDPYIPWELAVMTDQNPAVTPLARNVLGGEIQLGRVLMNAVDAGRTPGPIDHAADDGEAVTEPVRTFGIIAPDYDKVKNWSRHPSMVKELERLVREHGAVELDADFDRVVAQITSDPPNVLHLIGHGANRTDGDPGYGERESHVYVLADTGAGETFWTRLTARDLERLDPYMHDTSLVFLNACDAGVGGTNFVDQTGFARVFLEMGAKVVIAPIWSIESTKAAQVATDFYWAVFRNGISVGEAMRQALARVDFRDPASRTVLAYRLYGQSSLEIGPVARAPGGRP